MWILIRAIRTKSEHTFREISFTWKFLNLKLNLLLPFRFYGTTALSLASAGGHLNVMVMLREYASETRRRGPTPLIAAIATKQYQIVIHLEFAGFLVTV